MFIVTQVPLAEYGPLAGVAGLLLLILGYTMRDAMQARARNEESAVQRAMSAENSARQAHELTSHAVTSFTTYLQGPATEQANMLSTLTKSVEIGFTKSIERADRIEQRAIERHDKQMEVLQAVVGIAAVTSKALEENTTHGE